MNRNDWKINDTELAKLFDRDACHAVLDCPDFITCKNCSAQCSEVAYFAQKKLLEYLLFYCKHVKLLSCEVVMKPKIEEMLKALEEDSE